MAKCISNPNPQLPNRQQNTSTSHDSAELALSQSTIYRPLDRAKREIRICDLYPASQISAKLQCSLRIVPIDAAGKFVAFSYVWGREAETDTLYIDTVEHRIKPNLAAGLRRFRARCRQDPRTRIRPISIWVDAICINQDSTEERNHQVPLMRSIFSRCQYAFSWLGEAGQDSDFAMDCIAKIASVKLPGEHELLVQRRIFEIFCEGRPWVAIHNLLRREYWYRVWILQEFVLPANLVIACGAKALPWKNFRDLQCLRGCDDILECDARELRMDISHLDSETQDKTVAVFRTLWELVFILSRDESDFKNYPMDGFTSLIHFTMSLQATDPRDKIYGILALCKGIDIRPDYSKTTQQVYTDLAMLLLSQNSNLLWYSGIHFGKNINGLANISYWPSWVPDWDYITRCFTAEAILPLRQLESEHVDGSGMSLSFKKLEFEHLQKFTALHIRGQIWQAIMNPVPADEWLKPHHLSATLQEMYAKFYPGTSLHYGLRKPMPQLVALFLTIIQLIGYSMPRMDPEEDLAAGFCVNTLVRIRNGINDGSEVTKSILELSLSALLQMFAEQFETCNTIFDSPEMYKDAYLAKEMECFRGRVFFKCTTGHFGIGPLGARDGDLICKLYGSDYPYVLRKVDSHFVLVGQCCVLGFIGDDELDTAQSVMLEIW